MDERRRSVRVPVTGTALVPDSVDVQVLDISTAGVFLQMSHRVEPGTRGSLRLNLWGTPFLADVEVRRVDQFAGGDRGTSYRVGAVFVTILPESRQLIEQFANH
jgi:hypothetical protein